MSLRLIGALVCLAVPPLVAANLISNFECQSDLELRMSEGLLRRGESEMLLPGGRF